MTVCLGVIKTLPGKIQRRLHLQVKTQDFFAEMGQKPLKVLPTI